MSVFMSLISSSLLFMIIVLECICWRANQWVWNTETCICVWRKWSRPLQISMCVVERHSMTFIEKVFKAEIHVTFHLLTLFYSQFYV